MSILAGIGTAGVPEAPANDHDSAAVGTSPERIGLILSGPLSMCRTVLNVSGSGVTTLVSTNTDDIR